MVIGKFGCHAAARSTLQEADLEEIRFVHVFDCVDLLTEDSGNRVDADGTSAETFDNCAKQLPIDVVETMLVDIEELQRIASNRSRDFAGSFDFREIAAAFQQPVCDPRRSPATLCDFITTFGRDWRVQDF